MRTRVAIMVLLTGLIPVTRPAPSGDAAFLFAYRIKPGMDSAFEAGYRRHLDWHRAHRDSLTWLGWIVYDGREAGNFVDGTFGIAPKAFDDRVEPAADGADADRNLSPYVDPVYRQEFLVRRDLSAAAPLEAGRPAAKQKVVRVTLRPGSERSFEQVVRTMRPGWSGLDYAVYELVAGGPHPSFAIVVQFPDWAALQPATDPSARILRAAGSHILSSESEVWLYRPDLSYQPGERQP